MQKKTTKIKLRTGFIKCNRFQRILFFLFLLIISEKNFTFARSKIQNEKMTIIANHNSIVILRPNGITSSFIGGNRNLEDNTENSQILQKEKKEKRKKREEEEEKEEEEEEKENISLSKKNPKKYKMNKSKVRKKALAFGYLKDSSNFLGFYSISFPFGTSDEICRKALNVWLTNLRTKYKLTNYLWVAERQKNGTLHFHLLTNSRMPIKEVNKEMAEILAYYEKKGLLSFGFSSVDRYNGVDLSYAGKNRKNNKKQIATKYQTAENRRKFISRYITKYVTKQNQVWEFLPNHWSRSISALHHGVVLNTEEQKKAMDWITSPNFKGKIIQNEYCLLYFPTGEMPIDLIKRLLLENERVYKLAVEKESKKVA